jgi:lipid-binding SYLF domain-containing protein
LSEEKGSRSLEAGLVRGGGASCPDAPSSEGQPLRDNVRNAKGVLIIPRLLKGGFIFGGSGGSGALLARDAQTGAWSYPAYYTLGSVTVGPQIGGEAAELILMIMTQRGLDSMMASSVKLGADVEVAARRGNQPVRASRKTNSR